MLRSAAERNARAQMVHCPGSLAQRAETQPTSAPRTPQTAPPLCQPYQGGWQCHTSRWYNRQRSPLAGESLPTPPQIKPPLWAAQVHRTAEDLPLGGREMVADPSVTPEACRGRRVRSHRVRRAICPPGQRQVFHCQQHLKGHSLSGEVGLRPPTAIPLDWRQNFTVLGGRRTWSMCSRSTTNTTLPPLRRRIGRS